MAKNPAYKQVFQQLKKEIIDGEYSVGEFLPTESQLEKQFNVSRTTIRRATELLAREKLVHIKQGRGTRVLEYKTQQTLNLVTSVSETLRKKGYHVTTKSMSIDRTEATVSQAQELDIEPGDFLVRVERIQMADGRPIAIMKNFLLPDMVPDIVDYQNQFTSLYQFLERHYGIHIDSAKNSISARIAGAGEAEMLKISMGEPLLRISRTCYAQSKPVCLDRINILGDVYEFEMIMEGRDINNNQKVT